MEQSLLLEVSVNTIIPLVRYVVANFNDQCYQVCWNYSSNCHTIASLAQLNKKTAENLLELNANKKMVQDKLVKDTGQLGVTVHHPSIMH